MFSCLAVAVIAVALPFLAWAGNCTFCTESPFKEATEFLAGKGYSPNQYAVLLTWREAAHTDTSKVVTGYHVGIKNTTSTFDLYSDGSGSILTNADLIVWGIAPKNWELPPVEQEAKIPETVAEMLPVRPVPVTPSAKALPRTTVQLPSVDMAAILAEDQAAAESGGKQATRIGIVRSLPQIIELTGDSASVGTWQTLPDGARLWSVTLNSPGARAIRIHFSQLKVPAGVQLVVFSANNPVEAYGPYVSPFDGEKDLWSASCFSENVSVECSVPAGTDSTGLKVAIDNLAHTYKDLETIQWTKSAAGTCNNDVSCFSSWLTASYAVAAFTFIIYGDELYCTGSLLADTEPVTKVPYFLTANHCVSAQDGNLGASSMEFYWLYQTAACKGAVPALSSVPRTTGGADFLAGTSVDNGSDFALVRLRSAPPQGTTFLGWSSASIPIGTQVACIHHPNGDYKRISFANLTDTGSPSEGGRPVQPYDFFHESLWYSGTTEPGSSGSPLMVASSQLVIGQLWGGGASCQTPEEPDYFGRFDKSYPALASWLSPTSLAVDINQDGSIDSVDIQLVVNAALGVSIDPSYNADVDRSGTVDAVDVQLVILAVLNKG